MSIGYGFVYKPTYISEHCRRGMAAGKGHRLGFILFISPSKGEGHIIGCIGIAEPASSVAFFSGWE